MHNGKILIMGFQGYNTDFLIPSVSKIDSLNTIYSDAISGYAKWALDHPTIVNMIWWDDGTTV